MYACVFRAGWRTMAAGRCRMAIQAHAFRAGTSLVVAIPPALRQHVQVRLGSVIYWHLGNPYELVLGRSAHRTGGRPPGEALARELQNALKEIERLKQQPARPAQTARDPVLRGWMAQNARSL